MASYRAAISDGRNRICYRLKFLFICYNAVNREKLPFYLELIRFARTERGELA